MPSAPSKLVLATANPNKVKEMRDILGGLGIDVLTLADFPPMDEVDETGDTLEANALLKADAVYRHTGLPSLADDTGLEVDALGGRPGVYSARYAGPNASYEDNVAKLLGELKGIADADRTARFRTVMALRLSDTEHLFADGVAEGRIISERRGADGFGYDPVFVPSDGDGLTFAEMAPAEKNAISHRARALFALAGSHPISAQDPLGSI
jgi:XTP/dITP diphosphohydrolase